MSAFDQEYKRTGYSTDKKKQVESMNLWIERCEYMVEYEEEEILQKETEAKEQSSEYAYKFHDGSDEDELQDYVNFCNEQAEIGNQCLSKLWNKKREHQHKLKSSRKKVVRPRNHNLKVLAATQAVGRTQSILENGTQL